MKILEIDSLSKKFDGQTIFSNFSLSLKVGEKLLIKGKSGCGKSTLLKMILGFETHSSGTISVNSMVLSPETVWEIRKKAAYVPQEPELPPTTVQNYIHECFNYNANKQNAEDADKANELLEIFDLKHEILNADTKSISGGEKQRIVLTAALLMKRPIILLDEASSALDPKSKEKVISYLGSQENLTLLAVSHESEWEKMCGRTIELTEVDAK